MPHCPISYVIFVICLVYDAIHSLSARIPPSLQDAPWEPFSRNPPLSRGALAGKVLFIDAMTAGIAGDMTVAALLDLGVPLDVVRAGLDALALPGFAIDVLSTERSGIVAPRVRVVETAPQEFRDYHAIRHLIADAAKASSTPANANATSTTTTIPTAAAASTTDATMSATAVASGSRGLTASAAELALSAFRLLAEAEADCHGMPVDAVHFHEVGGVDSIVDIVATAIAIDFLAPARIVVSPLPMGRGIVRGAAHGPLPRSVLGPSSLP